MDEQKLDGGQENPSRGRVVLTLLTRLVLGLPAFGAALFLPAGTIAWLNGWLFLGPILALMIGTMVWMLVRDPEMLAKRLRTRETRPVQRRFVLVSSLLLLPAFLLPGFDYRFGWSQLPLWLSLAATVGMLAGFALFLLVIRHNRYASRVIEIQQGQRVIDTGPYRIVRHPMYASTVVIYLSVPLVLGSWPSLIAFAAFIALLPLRILNEEQLLEAELPGYADYMTRVRWRLVPHLW